jgi:hypothetical protein
VSGCSKAENISTAYRVLVTGWVAGTPSTDV